MNMCYTKLKRLVVVVICLSTVFILSSCKKFSEHISDKESGLNGGFEVSQNGIPVNWLMYTANTVPNSEFEIVLDKDEFKEGVQSLNYSVVKCNSAGGWLSPGFTNQWIDRGEGTYEINFWIKNEGTSFKFSAGGVSPKGGEMKLLVEENKDIKTWTSYKYKVEVPKDMSLRVELNILSPGSFWIDDFSINKIK